ncbi:MAG: hypothetical protein WA901_13990, partial [Phormidesmis sp.]
MRVSPALLACFSLVAVSSLPSQAADAVETVDSASTLDAPAESSSAFSQLLEGVVNKETSPLVAQIAQVPADTDVDIDVVPVEPDGGIETEPESAAPDILPDPAVPQNNNPSIRIPVDGGDIQLDEAEIEPAPSVEPEETDGTA